MSTAAAVPEHHLIEPAESPLTPESWGKLGMWVFLAADAMTFGALLAGYGALRYGDRLAHPPPSSASRSRPMTFLLICSSVTMVEGLAGIQRGIATSSSSSSSLTLIGACCSSPMQAYEWTHLIEHGQSIGNNFSATFFILTGFHGMRLQRRGVPHHHPARQDDGVQRRAPLGGRVAGLYWHFVDLVGFSSSFVYLI